MSLKITPYFLVCIYIIYIHICIYIKSITVAIYLDFFDANTDHQLYQKLKLLELCHPFWLEL